jgi:hypothetical protein
MLDSGVYNVVWSFGSLPSGWPNVAGYQAGELG